MKIVRLRDRLIAGTILNIVAAVFNQGSTFAVNIVVARLLMKQVYGEYAIVQSTLLTIASFSQLAMGYTAAKYVAEFRSCDTEKAGRILGMCAVVSAVMGIFGSVVLIVAASWLSDNILKAPHLANALIFGAGFLFFSVINGFQTGALNGLEAYSSLAKAGIISGILYFATIGYCTWSGGLNGAFIGLSISAFISCVVHCKYIHDETKKQGITIKYTESFDREKVILRAFAIPASISGFFSVPIFWAINALLVRQNGGYAEMAIFSAANIFSVAVIFLPQVLNGVTLSILNNEKGKGKLERYNNLFKLNVLLIFFTGLCSALLVGFFGRTLLQLFGKDFRGGQVLLWILLVTAVFEGTSVALYQYIQSNAKIWLSLYRIVLPRDIFRLLAGYYLIPLYLGIGLAFTHLIAAIIGFLLHFYAVFIIYNYNIRHKK